jgi:hypothetical protein
MSTTPRIMLALAILVGATSAAAAATKHPAHHDRVRVAHHVSADAYRSFGSTRPYGQIAAPPGGWPADYFGDPYNHQERKCIGGTCAPDWGQTDPY